jgi:hypothetical protein
MTAAAGFLGVLAFATAACGGGDSPTQTPGLAPRGTVMTTAKPARQDLTSTVSLAGKVTVDPVFGLVAPVAGQVRYATVTPPAGMPIVSARKVGYGIVADIDGASAYKISANLTSVRAQIDDGPGPFSCKVLGTIAALPAGTIPDPPVQSPQPSSSGPPVAQEPAPNGPPPSEPTGMRIVCLAPSSVRLINGAAVRLEIVTAQATGVLVLPVEAVAGGQGKGLVDVVRPDGTKETREVVLGMTDGRVIEIRSGLTEAETVAVPGPDIAAVPPDQFGKDNLGGGGVVKK